MSQSICQQCSFARPDCMMQDGRCFACWVEHAKRLELEVESLEFQAQDDNISISLKDFALRMCNRGDLKAVKTALSCPARDEPVTPDLINGLPDKLRKYIHDLETRCDPSGELRELIQTRENVSAMCVVYQQDIQAMGETIQTLQQKVTKYRTLYEQARK